MNRLHTISCTASHDKLEASRLRQQAMHADAALAAQLRAEAIELEAEAARLEKLDRACKQQSWHVH